ncbi:hypothetical protein GCM10010921_01060 [Microbacterium album]|uniref:AB hydrolase-1 domain-containing protein n=1 Tax=Microbacterium album TaxID=2053191 RepID=A0A917IC50_9MICO|nr:hypothetical protein GCM10010921_01060 [Microbacterium album]
MLAHTIRCSLTRSRLSSTERPSPRTPAARIDALASPWLDPVGKVAFYQQIAALTSSDTRDVAEKLGATRCPVRIGWGRDDPWLPLRQAYELQSRFPDHPDVLVLDDIGHLAPYEHPSAVAASLRDWFTPRARTDAASVRAVARLGSHCS